MGMPAVRPQVGGKGGGGMRLGTFHLQAIGPDEYRLVLEGLDGGQQVLLLSYTQVRELAQAATDATFAPASCVTWGPEMGPGGWQLAARRPGV